MQVEHADTRRPPSSKSNRQPSQTLPSPSLSFLDEPPPQDGTIATVMRFEAIRPIVLQKAYSERTRPRSPSDKAATPDAKATPKDGSRDAADASEVAGNVPDEPARAAPSPASGRPEANHPRPRLRITRGSAVRRASSIAGSPVSAIARRAGLSVGA